MRGSDSKPEAAEQSTYSGDKRDDPIMDANGVDDGNVSFDTKHVQYTARECDFDTDPSVLYSSIQEKNWKAAVKRAEQAPAEAMTWVSRKERDGRMRWRLLPLHAAIIFKAPEHVVESLLCAYPKGVQCKDDQGMLAIHLAFRHGSTEEVVNLLLVAYPQSIDVKDRKGRIPLELAQASASPNRETFVRALERGPSYYAVAAAATERAAVTAEQRAIFEAKLIQVRKEHNHEMENLRREYEVCKMAYQDQVTGLEMELSKTQETSQVLVDHVSSLEAQLASRSDTERFLATKIANLDASLKEASQTKEELEMEMKAELEKITSENEELKERLNNMQVEEGEEKQKLNKTEEQLACSISESKQTLQESQKMQKKQAEIIQHLEADLIGQRATVEDLETRLKNKIAVEQTLATQVSTLASKLAESAADSSFAASTYVHRIEQLDVERSQLRSTVLDLTNKLARVATTLDAVNVQQEQIVKAAADHEKTMAECTQVNEAFLEDARRQEERYENAVKERDNLAEILQQFLQQQGEEEANAKKNRDELMEKVESMREQMASSRQDRETLVCGVVNQRLEMRDLIASALSIVPDQELEEDKAVDDVIRRTMKALKKNEEEEETEGEKSFVPKVLNLDSITEPSVLEDDIPKEEAVAVDVNEEKATEEETTEEITQVHEKAKEETTEEIIEKEEPEADEKREDEPKEEGKNEVEKDERQEEEAEEPVVEEAVSKATVGTDDLTVEEDDRVLAARS